MIKHILIFSAQYLPSWGGVEKYTFNLSKELTNRGYKITVVPSNVMHLSDYEYSDGIEVYRLPCINLLNGRFPVLKFWTKKFWKLNKELKKNTFDFSIVNTRFYIHSLYGAIFGKKHSKKVICIEHGSGHLSIGSGFWDFTGRCYEHFITIFIKFFIKDFYGVSQGCNDWLSHFGIKAKGVLYNAIDIDDVEKLKTNMNTNFLPALPDGSKMLAFTGRLILEKGILEVMEAVKLCNTKYGHPEIHLMVAGDGPLMNECTSSKTDNIHLLGRLSFEQIVYLLSNSISLLLPSSYSEGFPTSVLEAVACRTYVIMTPVSGAKEILPDDSYGTVTGEKPSPDDIAKAIIDILYDDKRRIEATEKAYKRLVDNFTWKNTADKLLELL